MDVTYKINEAISVDQFVGVLQRSSLDERRPVDDRWSLQSMLEHSNLLITAWSGEKLVGVSRSLTDFSYCCYLSDLAVDQQFQHLGIGKTLIEKTKSQLGSKCKIILLASPAAEKYYPHIGFNKVTNAWLLPPASAK